MRCIDCMTGAAEVVVGALTTLEARATQGLHRTAVTSDAAVENVFRRYGGTDVRRGL